MAEIECEIGSMSFKEEDEINVVGNGSEDETGSAGSDCVTISLVAGFR